MQINLLFPFQTCPSASGLWANPEATSHVGALLMEVVKGQIAEEPFALDRFSPIIMPILAVVIEIEPVSKVFATRLTSKAAWRGLNRHSSPPSLLLVNNLGLNGNQEVAFICR